MLYLTVECDTSSDEENVAVVVSATSATCSEAMFALCFSTLFVNCLINRLGRSALG